MKNTAIDRNGKIIEEGYLIHIPESVSEPYRDVAGGTYRVNEITPYRKRDAGQIIRIELEERILGIFSFRVEVVDKLDLTDLPF